REVHAVAGFQTVDVLDQVAASFGADQGHWKKMAAALHSALAWF
nr:hypothetical protein [Tanacetum cinerariifolium]